MFLGENWCWSLLRLRKRVNLIIWNNIVRQMLYNNVKNIALPACFWMTYSEKFVQWRVESVNVVGTIYLYEVVNSWHNNSLGFNYVVAQMKCNYKVKTDACTLLYITIHFHFLRILVGIFLALNFLITSLENSRSTCSLHSVENR